MSFSPGFWQQKYRNLPGKYGRLVICIYYYNHSVQCCITWLGVISPDVETIRSMRWSTQIH